MATREYIGARYVPKFYQNSVDNSTQWENNVVYEPLTYVTLVNGHLYISKKQVPATVGTPAENTEYWLDVGSYNGLIEGLQEQIDELVTSVNELETLNENGTFSVTLTQLGTLSLPAGHTVQGCEIYDGYLYVFHHVGDTIENTISKYSLPGLTKIADLSLPDGMHGNGVTINRVGGYIIITNSYNSDNPMAYGGTLIYVPLSTFNSYQSWDYRGGGSTSISALCVSPDGGKFAESITRCPAIYSGFVSKNVGSPITVANCDYIGANPKQDISGSNNAYYALISGTSNINGLKRNYIEVITYMGAKMYKIMLPDGLDELEGISCTDDANLYIVDVNGKVYQTNISAVVSFNWNFDAVAGGRVGTFKGYQVSTALVNHPNMTVVTTPGGKHIATIIPCPAQLYSGKFLEDAIGTCTCANARGYAAVTSTNGLRLMTCHPNLPSACVNYTYNATLEQWEINSVQIAGGTPIACNPSTVGGIIDGLADWGDKTYLNNFGKVSNMRGYANVGLKLVP